MFGFSGFSGYWTRMFGFFGFSGYWILKKRKLIDTGFYFLVLFLGIGGFGFSDIGY
jgi:hypothetical protein